RGANATLTVDLPAQTIHGHADEAISFHIDAWQKHSLVNGLDEIGLTMQRADPIGAHEDRLSTHRPWI
ncbi:MAG: 3-isopropylmalate dehydratase small subunit, partial [Pseudomonadota bacterium]